MIKAKASTITANAQSPSPRDDNEGSGGDGESGAVAENAPGVDRVEDVPAVEVVKRNPEDSDV